MEAITHRYVQTNGIALHLAEAGKGPLVILLHGFPEVWYSWHHQLPALAAAGYHAVAPDLRGYGGTDKDGPYDLWTLTADVAALVRALGRERATIVGHDWGGTIAWSCGFLQPDVVERLVVLNAPHPARIGEELARNPRQLARSWYVFAFQIPELPERFLRANVGRMLRGGSYVRSAWTRAETEPYRVAFQQPGSAS